MKIVLLLLVVFLNGCALIGFSYSDRAVNQFASLDAWTDKCMETGFMEPELHGQVSAAINHATSMKYISEDKYKGIYNTKYSDFSPNYGDCNQVISSSYNLLTELNMHYKRKPPTEKLKGTQYCNKVGETIMCR